MGMRFRKSINLGGGARVNISKSGIGGSFGVKGARVTKTAKGTTRKTYSIPGTGISHITETSSKKKSQGKTANAATAPATISNKTLSVVFKILGALMIIFSCLLALVFPAPGIICIVVGAVLVVVGVKCGKKAKQEIQEE